MVRNVLMSVVLLCIAGCGCSGGGSIITFLPVQAQVAFAVMLPPVAVAPPQAIKVDITFVLDDSDTMNRATLSGQPGDTRIRSRAAQAVMRRLVSTLEAQLATAYGAHPPAVDLAISVARYEDFGGDFTVLLRREGDVDDPANTNNDQDARPFILNMPMLRRAHPEFENRFADALVREAPGDGNPFVPQGLDPARVSDPQSGIEALWQVAAPRNPDGSFGGFDGNDDGDTTDSGPPTSQVSSRNPQTRPGDSGDVPAIGYAAAGTDADGEPLYRVTDENGTVVMIPASGAAGTVPGVSSGNLGGVGWRPDSVRFVVLATDSATVSPFEAVALPTRIASSPGGSDAPREARSVSSIAFDGRVRETATGDPLVPSRTGIPGIGSDVAPRGAHTVEKTIARLNAMNIEVVLLGLEPSAGIGPSEETPVPLFPPTLPTQHDPTADDLRVYPELDPWFWLNAVSVLTTPQIDVPFESDDPNGFRGVYGLAAVWPLGTDESMIRDTVTQALVERLSAWVDPAAETGDPDSPYAEARGPFVPLGLRPTLPNVQYSLTLSLSPIPPGADVVQRSPDGSELINPAAAFPLLHWSDEAAPAPTSVQLLDRTELAIPAFSRRDDSVLLPATQEVTYGIQAIFVGTDVSAGSSDTAILAALRAGAPADATPGMVSIPAAPDPTAAAFSIADGARLRIWVRDATAPGFGVELLPVSQGCAFVSDATASQSGAFRSHCAGR